MSARRLALLLWPRIAARAAVRLLGRIERSADHQVVALIVFAALFFAAVVLAALVDGGR